MQKVVVFFMVAFSYVNSYAQNIAINNDASLPDNSAILDIKSGAKGLLIPRMNTAAIAAILNPAKGLLVLDTAKNQLLVNMGTPAVPNWQTVVAASGWGLNGNSGIDSAINFIGTTNTQPLIMRVNNVRSGYLDTITSNTSFGFKALDSFTVGNSNTAIGYKSLLATKTGANNTGVGWSALRSNLAGSTNIAIGHATLYNNQSGYSNVAIGASALYNSRDRSNLVAIGDSALFNNGTTFLSFSFQARDNIAIGSKSLFGNTRGYANTAIGSNALFSNTTGQQNVAVGTGSLQNSNGVDNTSAGFRSMLNNSQGFQNSAFGSVSLYNNSTGSRNSSFGTNSLSGNTVGSWNTAIGVEALFSNSTGSYNTALGASAQVGASDLTNATAIGAQAWVDCSNCLVLGSILGINGGISDVNVGIGTTTPNAPLTFGNNHGKKIVLINSGPDNQYGMGTDGGLLKIHSDALGSDIAFGYGSSGASFVERMRVKGNGNVGIGTNNPTRPLSFPPSIGEKILLYPGAVGEVGIGVYGNELRLHSDNPGAAVSFGTQTIAGVFTEAGRFQISGGYALFVNGNILANGVPINSDARFKQNITSIKSPIQKILQIDGVEYEMRVDEFPQKHFMPGRQIGLLAQNVEKVIPEVVSEVDGYKGVDYAKLVPLLIEGIKEQQKQIESSNDEVKQLKQELAELKKLVEQLMKK